MDSRITRRPRGSARAVRRTGGGTGRSRPGARVGWLRDMAMYTAERGSWGGVAGGGEPSPQTVIGLGYPVSFLSPARRRNPILECVDASPSREPTQRHSSRRGQHRALALRPPASSAWGRVFRPVSRERRSLAATCRTSPCANASTGTVTASGIPRSSGESQIPRS